MTVTLSLLRSVSAMTAWEYRFSDRAGEPAVNKTVARKSARSAARGPTEFRPSGLKFVDAHAHRSRGLVRMLGGQASADLCRTPPFLKKILNLLPKNSIGRDLARAFAGASVPGEPVRVKRPIHTCLRGVAA